MFAELLICISIVSFFIIVASYLCGSDKGIRFIIAIPAPIIIIAFILLNNYVWCKYERIIYNDYNIYETQVNTSKYNYYAIITNDGAYVVNKSIVEFVPGKVKQLVVTKYRPKYESFGLDNNRIKKVEIGV